MYKRGQGSILKNIIPSLISQYQGGTTDYPKIPYPYSDTYPPHQSTYDYGSSSGTPPAPTVEAEPYTVPPVASTVVVPAPAPAPTPAPAPAPVPVKEQEQIIPQNENQALSIPEPVVEPPQYPQTIPQNQIQPEVVIPYDEGPSSRLCMGPDSVEYTPQIMYFIRQELTQCYAFKQLTQSNHGCQAFLNRCACVCTNNANKLATAYFLITGKQFFPTNISGSSANTALAYQLRDLFAATQELEGQYREAALKNNDRCLISLYNILADAKVSQSACILRMLEG